MNFRIFRKSTSVVAVALPLLACHILPYAASAEALTPTTTTAVSDQEFSTQYTQLTKQILLGGIEIERFSLNYRRETAREPRFRKLRYFSTQEAGIAGIFAFEVIGLREFGKGRHRPLKVSIGALKRATTTATVSSIIAGSGSCLELASNVVHCAKLHNQGFDSRTANKFVANKLRELDLLLQKRDALIAANPSNPAHDRAVAEGDVLREMRSAFVNEYSHFNADMHTYRAAQNAFFLLNASYNAVGATAAGLGHKALYDPRLNGPANILFIVSGAAASATPILSAAAGVVAGKIARRGVEKAVGEKIHFDPEALVAARKRLDALAAASPDGSLMPALPSTQRTAIYAESNKLFLKQLESESRSMRSLNKVALGSCLLGPEIGGLLMTQGILGTHGYYQYTYKPKKQLGLYYGGSVCGTVASSVSGLSNVGLLLASWSYEHKLKKNHQLPDQLIQDRLDHLDDLQKTITAI